MQQFDYNKIKDPGYFSQNRLKAHSDHVYYASIEEMYEDSSSFYYPLNGLWKFAYAKNIDSSIKGFEKWDYDTKAWDDIHVPAHIQMEGYDAPQYVNVQYPWDGREQIEPGEIPTQFNPVASYVKYFTLPKSLQEAPVYISFQGVESGMALWLNGEFVGYSEDSFTPSEFDLTPFLVKGVNKIALQVFKWTSGSWCEDQDFFRFSGIFRNVYLFTVPKVHIYDLKIQTLLNDRFDKADLDIQVIATQKGTISFTLLEQDQVIKTLEAALDTQGHYVMKVHKPKLWSAEEPNLYQLLIQVKDEKDVVVEVMQQQVGFRRFEIRDSLMLLNGKRIVIKGVNRHEFSSRTGRVVSEEDLIQDLVTIKKNNMNAIRTSHYPNNSKLYELCDSYGIYLMDENNLETHGIWDGIPKGRADISTAVPGDKEEWLPMLLDRVNSMYQRDKNHPSILIWSCGNEAFGGKDIYRMSQKLRALDGTRPIHYEGIFNDRRYNDTSDIESRMYPHVSEIQEFLQKDRRKPFLCCEYMHAMGNSCGGMHKYTDLTDTEPLFQGGFIWDYIDQSITKKDRYGKEFQAYGGDFDDHPCDYNFSGNGIVYGGNRDASPKMQTIKYNYQNIAIQVDAAENKVFIQNKNLFVNTNTFACMVTLQKNGKVIHTLPLEVDIDPLSEKEYRLPLLKQKRGGEYTVTVSFLLKEDTIWAAKGHEVAFGQNSYQIPLQEKEKIRLQEEKDLCRQPLEVIQGKLNVGIKGGNFDVLFSTLNGGLVSYRYAGVEMIKAIPKPNFWRAPVDNDYGSNMPAYLSQWKIASMYLTHKNKDEDKMIPKVEKREESVKVTFTYYLPTTPASECMLSYEVMEDGRIATKLIYEPTEDMGEMPEFGVIFKFDADYKELEWYGMGPEETYGDRQRGSKLGIYHNQVEDNVAKYLVPQESGNKVGVRYAKITNGKGRGICFTGDKMNFSALPYTPHEVENAMHSFELPQIHYTVVRVSRKQMGIAGEDSWGTRPEQKYMLNASKKMEFEFSFKGI
ncbi:MAG: glycoside hydrolase family 2 TIM barrel-domain containing protein [Lachnospiraceae bacterium]|nr:glycoside hydrolase family 2 TIM barrel-domain containing protein [Lachnospiraceae bacterium]